MARPYQVQSHQPVQYRPPPQLQLQPMTVQALRTPNQQREQGGLPKGTNKLLRKGLEKMFADDALTQAEAKQILTSDAAYTGGSAPGLSQAEATKILTSDAAYGGGGAAGTAAGSGVTTLGGANTIAGLGGGISGSSVTGGSAGAGLGGAGAGTATGGASGAGLAAAAPAAAVVALPFVASALDEGQEKHSWQALDQIKSGDFEDVNGLKMTRVNNLTFLSGPKNVMDRARTAAEKRGIKTFETGKDLITLRANPENTRTALKGLDKIKPDPTIFADYRHPRRRSYGGSNPMTTALRGR